MRSAASHGEKIADNPFSRRPGLDQDDSSGMDPYPLLLEPILKPKVWGGRWLSNLGKKLPEGQTIGESWELADLPPDIPGGRSAIANGPLAGTTLHDAIRKHHGQIMGAGRLTGHSGFPLLIKYLDARENLSVQVHPNEDYAARRPECHLKSEAWVVIHAAPGAVIYTGIRPEVGASQFEADLASNDVVKDLVAVPARAGDCHYLPSGTCHALGAGVVVAEVQTPSDTTFRVYDWGRTGVGRDLHIRQAMECIRFGPAAPARKLPPSFEVDGIHTASLAMTEHFQIERLDAREEAGTRIETSELPEIWMMIQGAATIDPARGGPVKLHPGDTTLIPAALAGANVRFSRQSWLLRVTLPSPLRGMIA